LIPPLRYEYHAAIAHPCEPRVLLLPGEGGWRLPEFGGAERRFWQDVDHVNRGLRDALGLAATTLRCMAIDYSRDQELLSKVYAVAPSDPAWSPPAGARWATRGEAGALPLALERHRPIIADWFAWYGEGRSRPQRAPWYMPGWFEEAAAWAAARLAEAGMPPKAPAEQLRSWQRSAILRIPTARGPAYFKAVPPMFDHEPALTAALAAAMPGRFAEPVAVDAARGWLLMRELPGPTLDRLTDELALWEAALASYAELQIASAARAAELRALGVPERPLAALTAGLEGALAELAAAAPDSPDGLTPDDRARLRSLGPWLRERAAALDAYGLPLTIEHGDFWPGQVVAGPGGFGFLDWSDSSLAHPFFSLLLFLVELDDFFPREPHAVERLRDAYLRPWAAAYPGRDLAHAFELAQPLAALHHARAYHELVLPNMEVKWELELMLPFFLKLVLRNALLALRA
jgi:hypothetical protein